MSAFSTSSACEKSLVFKAMDPQSLYNDPQKLFAAMTGSNPNLPMPKFLDLAETRRMARSRSNAIFADRDALLNILERYEETLRKRWGKKTSEQRRKVLLRAYPGMPSMHRPDFEALRRESPGQIKAGTQFYDSFFLPSLNLEDLLKPRTLLIFLNARGRHDPDLFANIDFNSIHLAQTTQALNPAYISGYTMLLIGQKSASKYGRLISWDEDVNAVDMMSSGIGIQPGEGLLIMEIQQRKLSFLRSCAETILQDLPLHDTTVPEQPSPPDLSIGGKGHSEDSEWPSLTKEILEAPYRVPDQFDIGRLRSFVSAKRDEAEDHIWSLREDPAYFKSTVLEWSEHRQEKILSVNGSTHPVLRRDTFWERVLGNVVVDAYLSLLYWDQLQTFVEELVALKDRNVTRISPSAPLPKKYDEALCHFSHTVDQMIKGPMLLYKTGMPSSPPLRNHYARQPQDPNSTKIIVTSKSSSYQRKDHCLWLLEQLLKDDQVFLCGLENLLDEIERMLRADAKSRERVSPWVARVLSDLSLLGEFRRQVGLLRPGPPMIEAVSEEDQQAQFTKRMKLFARVHETFQKNMVLSSTGTPLSKFNYPSDKRLNPHSTKALQEAERNLDAFWSELDRQFLENGGESLQHMLAGVLTHRDAQRTPDWKDDEESLDTHCQNTDGLPAQVALLELQTRTEKTITSETPQPRSEKIKTRGAAAESEDPPEAPTKETESKSPNFIVSKRGFKVFTTLFHTASGEDPPGEVPWSDFLSAMASVGFSLRKLDCSAWVFEPVSDLFRRSIIFHEPHPTNKIPFQVARRYGRRLERAYGWTGASFSRV